MDLSVVIPVRNEAPNIAPLVAEIRAALDGMVDYEIVYVDDGSSDDTAAAIRALARTFPRLRLVCHARSCGQPARHGSRRSTATGRTIRPTSRACGTWRWPRRPCRRCSSPGIASAARTAR
jgi:dolichol-phosphate mannosyltransferase